MAEQLGLQQILRNAAAIDCHEGQLGLRAVIMDRPRDELLAGPAFTQQEDVGRRIPDLADRREDPEHVLVPGDHVAEVDRIVRVPLKRSLFLLESLRIQGLPDEALEVIDVEILLDIVVGPLFHRAHRGFTRRISRNQDHEGPRRQFLDGFEKLEAVHFRHLQVRQDEIEVFLPAPVQALHAVRFADDAVPFPGQHDLEQFPDAGVVIHNKDSCHPPTSLAASAVTGFFSGREDSQTATDVPRPGSLSRRTRPPWFSTMRRTIASPSPVPRSRVV